MCKCGSEASLFEHRDLVILKCGQLKQEWRPRITIGHHHHGQLGSGDQVIARTRAYQRGGGRHTSTYAAGLGQRPGGSSHLRVCASHRSVELAWR